MYLEIIDFTNNGRWLTIKFHEGPLNNRVFQNVSPHFILPFIVGQKIPFNQAVDEEFMKAFRARKIRLNEDGDKELFDELQKFV